jgi:hypothetical protein
MIKITNCVIKETDVGFDWVIDNPNLTLAGHYTLSAVGDTELISDLVALRDALIARLRIKLQAG